MTKRLNWLTKNNKYDLSIKRICTCRLLANFYGIILLILKPGKYLSYQNRFIFQNHWQQSQERTWLANRTLFYLTLGNRGSKLNVHNFLCTFIIHPVSRGYTSFQENINSRSHVFCRRTVLKTFLTFKEKQLRWSPFYSKKQSSFEDKR